MTEQLDKALEGFSLQAEYLPQDLTKIEDARGVFKVSDLNKVMLEWHIVISLNGREVITTPYKQGLGHLPGFNKLSNRWVIDDWNALKTAVRDGKEVLSFREYRVASKIPAPKLADVMYCLISDSNVIDYSCFEQWADEYGYDTDSRSAEKTYNECLSQALKLRSAIGNDRLEQLREAFQDY